MQLDRGYRGIRLARRQAWSSRIGRQPVKRDLNDSSGHVRSAGDRQTASDLSAAAEVSPGEKQAILEGIRA